MKLIVSTLLLLSSACVHAITPASIIKDSCGIDIAKSTDCFALKELNTNKWVTTGTSSNKKWLALSSTTASMFAFKKEEEDTTGSLGCRVHYFMVDGTWSTFSDDRGFLSWLIRKDNSGVQVINASNTFGKQFPSMIAQNADFSYGLYSGKGSCTGHGCVGPYITKVKKGDEWLESSEKVTPVAKYEVYYQQGIDCTKVFTLKATNLQTCNPTKKSKTTEMKTPCTDL